MDISKTIAPKSDQINSDDLLSGPRTIRITRVTGNEDPQQPVNVFFEGDDGKPFRPCKSMRRVMVNCWGPDAHQYVGRAMTLYRDPSVTFGGMQVGGIRISHMSHISGEQKMALTASKAKRAIYTVKPLAADAASTPSPDTLTPDPDHIATAREQAAKGTAAFKAWWSDNQDMRPSAKTIMPELQKTCADADAAMSGGDDDELPM